MTDQKTLDVYTAKAAEYAGLSGNEGPDQDLRDFMTLLPAGGRVLDLGCGPADASANMRNAGFDPDPVDASEGMVTLANDTHDIGARLGTFDDITGTAIYDGIWANFSLLHAPRDDLPRYLNALAGALRPDGIFHIGMKTGTGAKRDTIDRLYTYVTTDELNGLLTDAGLTIIDTRTGETTGLDGVVAPFVIMRARKDQDA